MATLTFSPRAEDDLRAIGDYIARDAPQRAVTFIHELREACSYLRDFPRLYQAAPRYGPDTHQRTFGNYVIIYDVSGDDVRILTIVHAARDLDSLPD